MNICHYALAWFSATIATMHLLTPQAASGHPTTRSGSLAVLSLLAALLLAALAACGASAKRVVILVDGQRLAVDTQAMTVDEVLRAQKIALGPDDRVDPPGYTPIDRTATIRIVRVEIKTEKKGEPVEFSRRLIRDDALPDGQLQVVQLGANGQGEVTYQVTLEDHTEVSRREIGRTTVIPPREEILEVGTQNSLPRVRLSGTVAYLAHGNAWVIRDSSDNKTPLTFGGDLDGRVFDLSPDGRFLIYTRSGTDKLNSLWLADTVILGEKPMQLPLDNLLYAQWAADGSGRIAYSTGEKTGGAPGWKAHNDLSIATLHGITSTLPITSNLPIPTPAEGDETGRVELTTRQIVAPSVPALYAWWGGSVAWSPDGGAFAYAFADQVGFINIASGSRRVMKRFAFYNTSADWVWTPQITWSPDSRFILTTAHSPPTGAGLPEDSPSFDLWALARDDSVDLAMIRDSGMWSAPVWSPSDQRGESRIAYGVALNPSDSERSPYALYVMDRDGSARTKIFPQGDESGLRVVQVAWSPDDSQLVAIRDRDLWLYDFHWGVWLQLTANGDSRLPRWK